MRRILEWFAGLDGHPWWRGLVQGLAAAVALAIGEAAFGRPWDVVLVTSAAVFALFTVVFGTVLSVQRRRPGRR